VNQTPAALTNTLSKQRRIVTNANSAINSAMLPLSAAHLLQHLPNWKFRHKSHRQMKEDLGVSTNRHPFNLKVMTHQNNLMTQIIPTSNVNLQLPLGYSMNLST